MSDVDNIEVTDAMDVEVEATEAIEPEIGSELVKADKFKFELPTMGSFAQMIGNTAIQMAATATILVAADGVKRLGRLAIKGATNLAGRASDKISAIKENRELKKLEKSIQDETDETVDENEK